MSPLHQLALEDMIKKSTLALQAMVAIVVVVAFVVSGYQLARSFNGDSPKVVVEGDYIEAKSDGTPTQLGGLVNNAREYFTGGINADTFGGSVATIASGAVTYTAAQLCDNAMINRNLSGGPASAQSDKFAAASALITRCLPNIGDRHRILFNNISNNEILTLTNAVAGGIDILTASRSSNVMDVKQSMMVEFWNFNGASVSATMTELTND